ncbi:23427_t:CDS:2, partial [Racocetra persica]
KSYKTCARCMSRDKNKVAAKKDNLDEENTIIETISIHDISDYIANAITDLDIHSKLSLTFGIQLDKVTLSVVVFEQQKNNEKNCTLCFQLETDNTAAISFTTKLLSALYYTEVHCDATYKTSKSRFKLYSIVDNVEGT